MITITPHAGDSRRCSNCRKSDFWPTTPYFHPVLEDYRGAVIIDCGVSARATALAMVRGIADQLQGGGS